MGFGPDEGGEGVEELGHVVAQAGEGFVFLDRGFVEIEFAVDFDLQGLRPLPFQPVAADDFAAFIRVVAGDGVAHMLQDFLYACREGRRAAGAVAIAEDEIGTGGAVFDAVGHGVDVEQIARAELGEAFGDLRLQAGVIGAVIKVDAALDLGSGEGGAIERDAVAAEAADEAETGEGHFVGRQRGGPDAVERLGVDVGFGAVGVDHAARKFGGDKGSSRFGGAGDDFVDIGVFRLAQERQGAGIGEIDGVDAAAMGGIDDQGGGRCGFD